MVKFLHALFPLTRVQHAEEGTSDTGKAGLLCIIRAVQEARSSQLRRLENGFRALKGQCHRSTSIPFMLSSETE